GRIATKRAGESTMLNAGALNGVLRWNARIKKSLERARESRSGLAPPENWITETAHALYGGEEGLSDSFVSTLWWLDELGLLAREGVDKLFRQALIGARYGLLDQTTVEPRPDYFASFLWKKLMGEEVLQLPITEAPDRKLRGYLHRGATKKRKGLVAKRFTVLLINLDRNSPLSVSFTGGETRWTERYLLQGEGGFLSKNLTVNGVRASDDLVFAWGKKATREKYRCDSFSPAELPTETIEVLPVSALFLSAAIS
ncbi:MAG: glycoside hydrolase, partial [Treponemataceae bacterium]